MKLIVKLCWLTGCLLLLSLFLGLVADKQQLQKDLIRLHVVANSDSDEDQAIKLQVRDAITATLEPAMENIESKEQAYQYIVENLTRIEETANKKLEELGVSDRASVSLQQEKFNVRHYDTFSLPAGIYDSLRVEIGSGSGKNWWCVVFPTLCLPAASSEFQTAAVSSGFDADLSKTLVREDGYVLRFYLLDLLGRLENFFCRE